MREIAYQYLLKEISSRRLRAGSSISELSIAQKLGISRTPTREAIRRLAVEGFLEDTAGRSVQVVTLMRRDIEEIYEIRTALEMQAVQQAVPRLAASKEMIRNLREMCDAIQTLVKEMEQSGQEELNEEQMTRYQEVAIGFRIYIQQAGGNRRIVKILSNLRTLVRIFAVWRKAHTVEEMKAAYQQHCDLLAAIEARDAERAAALLKKHIEQNKQDRLRQFDELEREDGLPADVPTFLETIRAELV